MLTYTQKFYKQLLGRGASKYRRCVCPIVALFIIIFLYIHVNKYIEGSYTWRTGGRKCRNNPKENDELLFLIKESHEVLTKMKIDHFLSYGSLFGALRYKNPLPWDYDYDFGILYEDFKRIDEKKLFYEFNRRGIQIIYQYYAGNYKVFYKGQMTGDIMIFRDYYNDGIMRRIGLESWLFFVHYRYYHQFPSKLIQKPLPTMMFSDIMFSVPREGIEIQKYLYPHNWWKEESPPGCNSKYLYVEEKK